MAEPVVLGPAPKAVNGYNPDEEEFKAVLYIPVNKATHREEVDGFVLEWKSDPNGDGTTAFELKVTKPKGQDIPFLTHWALNPASLYGFWIHLGSDHYGHPRDWPFHLRIPRLEMQEGSATLWRLTIWEA